MEEQIEKIIRKSELYYTVSKLIDSESLEEMVKELIEKLLKLKDV